MVVEVTCVVRAKNTIGEGAFWDQSAQCLWWVDIPLGTIHRLMPETGRIDLFEWGESVGCLAPRAQGGLVLATKSGFWLFDPETGSRVQIDNPEADKPENRFNDGATDAFGRFWAGTMKDADPAEAVGRFYRLNTDLSVTPWQGGFYTTNGLAFSPDGTRMYFSDSNAAIQTIWTCDYDAETGQPGSERTYFDSRTVAGRPDGGTVDAEGNYWMAGVGGGHLCQISPLGKVLHNIELPIQKPTKPMFGGKALDTLYVTSIDDGGKDAGGLFAVTGLGVTGVEQTLFAG